MAPTKPASASNTKTASAGPTSARSYRRQQPQAQLKRGDGDTDDASDTTHEAHPSSELIDSRRNDFSKRSWWMVDVECDGEGSSTQGATSLVKRCMRAYGWNLPKTRKILSAYKQFLILKKIFADWDATLLSPCHLVDQMWHQHILDNFNYYHDVMLLCGHFVGHNPDGALDFEGKLRRDQFTRKCLRQHFGNYVAEVWDDAGSQNKNRVKNCAVENANDDRLANEVGNANNEDRSDDDANENDESELANVGSAKGGQKKRTAAGTGGNVDMVDEDDADKITFRIKDQMRKVTMFTTKRTIRMSQVFGTMAMRKGVDTTSLVFMLDGEVIMPDATPVMLDLEDDDQIDCLPRQCGC